MTEMDDLRTWRENGDGTYTIRLDRVPFPGEAPIEQTRIIGDGKAAGAPPDGEPVFGNFSGPREPVPSTTEPWYDTRKAASVKHVHDDTCLTAIEGGPKAVPAGLEFIPEPGWFTCSSRAGIYLHDHGTYFAAHMSGAWRGGCPQAIVEDVPWA